MSRLRNVLLRDGVSGIPRNAAHVMSRAVRIGSPMAGGIVARARDSTSHEASQALLGKYLFKSHLGMTSPNEQAYFEWYARHCYTGAGAIVDLGCWLGSTTIPLAVGLDRNPKAGGTVIEAYDRFIWEHWMETTGPGATVSAPGIGESFLPEFEGRVERWRHRIRTHAADLFEEQWTGGPIEFLLVDAMKSWEICDAIVRNFFPHVAAGGFILQQDFSHYYTPWVHVVNFRLRDFLRPVFDVPAAASSVFQVTEPIPAEIACQTTQGLEYDRDDVEAIFGYSMSFVPEAKRGAIGAAKSKMLFDLGRADEARYEMRIWQQRYPRNLDLAQLAALIAD